jgi:hypothetical protein
LSIDESKINLADYRDWSYILHEWLNTAHFLAAFRDELTTVLMSGPDGDEIQAPGTRTGIIYGIRFWIVRTFRLVPVVVAVSLASVSFGCRKPAEAVTLTFLDPQ